MFANIKRQALNHLSIIFFPGPVQGLFLTRFKIVTFNEQTQEDSLLILPFPNTTKVKSCAVQIIPIAPKWLKGDQWNATINPHPSIIFLQGEGH